MTGRRALFVTHRSHIGAGKGGVQMCTQEYVEVLQAAGFSLDIVQIEHDSTPLTRLTRHWNSSPYLRPIRREDIGEVVKRSDASGAEIIFFNQVALSSAAGAIASLERKRTKKIILSHGCEITDMLHAARLKSTFAISARLRPTAEMAIARTLTDESRARLDIDGVIALSAFDAAMETWFGAPHVTWLPRVVRSAPLPWQPTPDRFGFVGTLDHAPNLEGLVAVLAALDRAGHAFRIEALGGPKRLGRWLERRFPAFRYLGPLDDTQLRAAASKWRAFINPIFCQARGCSTKLAVALGWEIPIVTTAFGRRGYLWNEGGCTEANNPEEFVAKMFSLLDDRTAYAAQKKVGAAANSSPTLDEVASRVSIFLMATNPRAVGEIRHPIPGTCGDDCFLDRRFPRGASSA